MKKCLVSCIILTMIIALFVPFSNVKANNGTLGQISIWSTDGGKVAAQYTPSDPNTENLPTLDGTVYWDNLTSVQFYVGDEVTAKAEANQSYQFAGWFQADIDYQEGSTEHPRKFKGNPLSTDLSYTYQPGVTVSESNETIWYVCAVFKERISVIEEIVPGDVESEEVPPSTDLADYINSKRWDVSTTDSNLNNSWQALFVAENDVYSYPKQGNVTYVFLRQEIHDTNITNYYRIEYTKVNVTHAPEDDGNNNNQEPSKNIVEYTISNDAASATFMYEKGHDFELVTMDVLSLSAEQLESLGVSQEQFEQLLTLIKDNTKDIGSFITLYAIEINEGQHGYTGEVKFRMKITGEMRPYNSFKFVFLNDENNFEVGDIADFSIDGEYITGTLPHLSAYALVGSVVETSETAAATNNPATGDNIIIYVSILAISTIGIVAMIIHKKKKKEN